jgi:hypothetical protein
MGETENFSGCAGSASKHSLASRKKRGGLSKGGETGHPGSEDGLDGERRIVEGPFSIHNHLFNPILK